MKIVESNKEVRISFIVPVYNMKKYLTDCIDSILKQTVMEKEIILVDDGSVDESVLICDSFAEKYDFIRVIHKENGGISSARNAGIRIAQGDYICFVDSDDFFKCDFSCHFLELCYQNNLDIIRGWYGIYEEDTKTYSEHEFPFISYNNQVVSGREFLRKSVYEHANEVVPWLGFFKREYLLKHNLHFPDGIAYEEDQLFFLEALLCDSNCRVMQTDLEFYAYRKRVGSATKTPTLKHAQDIIFVVDKESKLIEHYGINEESVYRYICSSFYQLTSIYGRVHKEDKRQIAKMAPMWMKWQCICHPYDQHQQIKIFLFTFFRWIVDLVYKRRELA